MTNRCENLHSQEKLDLKFGFCSSDIVIKICLSQEQLFPKKFLDQGYAFGNVKLVSRGEWLFGLVRMRNSISVK